MYLIRHHRWCRSVSKKWCHNHNNALSLIQEGPKYLCNWSLLLLVQCKLLFFLLLLLLYPSPSFSTTSSSSFYPHPPIATLQIQTITQTETQTSQRHSRSKRIAIRIITTPLRRTTPQIQQSRQTLAFRIHLHVAVNWLENSHSSIRYIEWMDAHPTLSQMIVWPKLSSVSIIRR